MVRQQAQPQCGEAQQIDDFQGLVISAGSERFEKLSVLPICDSRNSLGYAHCGCASKPALIVWYFGRQSFTMEIDGHFHC
jgi:hypothetical protein